MQTIYGLDAPFPADGPAYVALGVFDGVHVGHQRFLADLAAWARAEGGRAVVITFRRHPLAVLDDAPPAYLTSLEHRLLLFEALGVDVCVVLAFDEALAAMTPEAFLRDVVHDWIGARGLQLGYDQRFGRNGGGDAELARRVGDDLGFEVGVASAVSRDGRAVSSTAIRRAVVEGDLDAASAMLGRPVSVLGRVVPGRHVGRELGFPTANLDTRHELSLPEGVYVVTALLRGRELPGVANIGRRPTLRDEGPAFVDTEAIVEVHLFDFDEDIYGREVEVRFLTKLRDEIPYRDAKRLAARIEKDVADARAYFRNAGRGDAGR